MNWFKNIQEKTKKDISIVLVANKSDITNDLIRIEQDEGQSYQRH